VRFDDRLATVLKGDPNSPRGRSILWRQLIDLLAQDGMSLDPRISGRALRLLAVLAKTIDPDVRVDDATSVAANCRFPPLIAFFAKLDGKAASAVLQYANLSEEDWLVIIGELGPLGRNRLRQRNDLPSRVYQLLNLHAPGDTALPPPATIAGASIDVQESTEIRELVRRIEEFKLRREQYSLADPVAATEASSAVEFQFRTDDQGRIIDVETAPRGRFIGLDLSQPARPNEPGCDAGTARMISKRSPVTCGRLVVWGDDLWSGIWLIDGEPQFDRASGAFRGYAGSLRRPDALETPQTLTNRPSASGISPDLVRQLVHELRSPLNAINGFAHMIDSQFAGPVIETYRQAARSIMQDSMALLAAIDEIDLMATGPDVINWTAGLSEWTITTIIDAVVSRMDAGLDRMKSILSIDTSQLTEDCQIAASSNLDRLLYMLLRPVAAGLDGTQSARLSVAGPNSAGEIQIVVERPPVPFESAEAHDEEIPGLGFGFAAARRLAEQAGGALRSQGNQYILNLPILRPAALAEDCVN
jgi:hypothetical protein